MDWKLLLIVLVAITGCYSTSLSTFGNDFYVGFYEHVHTANTHQFFVHTLLQTSVSFQVTSLDGGFSYSGTCSRGSPATVSIPFSYEVRGNTFSYRKKGIRITSLETEPISVITWSYRSAADYMAYLAYPCHKQPTTEYVYYVVSSYGWSSQKGMFLLVGCHDNTNVIINAKYNIVVPNDAQDSNSGTKTVSAGQNYTLTLHSLQTFLIYVTYADITASKIISDQPLTVISGHEAAQIPASTYDADPTSTQVIPTIQWGKTFLLAPHTGQVAQNFRIIAYLDGTVIVRTCGSNSITTNTLSKDSWLQFFIQGNTYCSIESTKPIYLAQLGVSDSYNGGSYGDPCVNTVASMEQYTNAVQYTTMTASYHYYSVVMPNDEYFNSQILYDGTAQSKSWTNIYYQNGSIAGYGFTSSAPTGGHSLAHPNANGKLFVSIFGWSRYGGYCYDAGMNLNAVNQLIALPQITFTSEEYLVLENNGTVYIYIERKQEFAKDVTVNFTVVPSPADTATSGVDYQVKSMVVSFEGNGDTVKKVEVAILDDLISESTEYFTIKIEPLVGDVTFPINEAVVGITDNDDVLECNINNGGCQQNCTNTFEGSDCSCYANYKLNANNQTCDPVCSDACGNCLSCDSPGMCTCIEGWKGTDCCKDEDECDIKNGGCQQKCHNTDGGHYCSCNQGYVISDDHYTCNDIDECDAGTDGCNHQCVNNVGSYLCYCFDGYELHDNDKTCEDTNECAVNNGGCGQICTNTIGSFTCSCNDGYDIDTDQLGCVDIDECTLTVSCEHDCYNNIGSFSCDCKSGYQLNSDGVTCQDIDECTSNTDGCDDICVNEVGTYHCECNVGFELDDDKHGCSDHNECLSNIHVCEHNCNNSHGAYTCSCFDGYRLAANNKTCDEIDECAEFISGCNQICQNYIGSYSCQCYNGFSLSADQHICEDINECDYKNGGCELNCINTNGSYYCSCADGYYLTSDFICADVNECQENNGGCSASCTNTDGSYYCTCNTGFQLDEDRLTCIDVNECLSRRCEHNCTNNYGSFSCSCDVGYELTGQLFCADIDECARGTSNCEQNCYNRLATYYCDCNEGYDLALNQYSCIDIDECATNTSKCQQLCNNTIGGYNCTCIDSYYPSGYECIQNPATGQLDGTSSVTTTLPFIIPAIIIIIILAVALVLALVFGRRKQTTKTFKVPDRMANTNDFQSTVNPLYDEAQGHSNVYDHLKGDDGVSVNDTITASMLDYCDDEKRIVS